MAAAAAGDANLPFTCAHSTFWGRRGQKLCYLSQATDEAGGARERQGESRTQT